MPGTLLLADDSITIQKVVELTFAETEHKVIAVGSGRDLFKRLPEVKPDVVLCDVVMPDMNGYEVCQTLKSDPATLHIPVVLLTGTFEPFDRDRALAAGCDAIVTKPFEARDLISTVEDLITRAKAIPAASTESGTLGEQGISEGVPSLDFSGSGFEKLAPPPPPPVPAPENGIDLTASSLGDSNPPLPRPAPPELQEPAATPSFAFGEEQPPATAEQPVVTAPAPDAFFPTKPVEPEAARPVSSPPSFGGEDQGAAPFVAEGRGQPGAPRDGFCFQPTGT
jgi:CheY-like chemotaxis protein